MADYRLYILDPDGHVARSIELQFATDEEAVSMASSHPHSHGMELWQLGRRVQIFEPMAARRASR